MENKLMEWKTLQAPLWRTLKALEFPKGQWCIVGGASLAIRGIRLNKNDVDLLVTDDLYAQCQLDQTHWIECELSENGERKTLILEDSHPPIELLPLSHFNDTRPVSIAYILNADEIDGLPVIRPQDMLEWKIAANRDKDKQDVVLLQQVLVEVNHG